MNSISLTISYMVTWLKVFISISKMKNRAASTDWQTGRLKGGDKGI